MLLAPIVCAGQTIKERKIDKFNGVETILTSKEAVVSYVGVSQVSAQGAIFNDPKNKVYQFCLYLNFPSGGRVGSLKQNESTVTLLFENGEPFELRYSGPYKLYSGGEVLAFYSILNSEQVKALSENKVTDLRIPSYDYKIKEKQQAVISSIASLMLANEPRYTDSENVTTQKENSTANKKSSLADELKKLKDMLDTGALTQEEYDAAKKKLLGQ